MLPAEQAALIDALVEAAARATTPDPGERESGTAVGSPISVCRQDRVQALVDVAAG